MLIRPTASAMRALGLLAALALSPASTLFAQAPDFTADGVIATIDRKLTCNLGATGMHGWIHTKEEAPGDNIYGRTTGASRQILVMHVGKDSPADGVMQVDDVILGIDASPSRLMPARASPGPSRNPRNRRWLEKKKSPARPAAAVWCCSAGGRARPSRWN